MSVCQSVIAQVKGLLELLSFRTSCLYLVPPLQKSLSLGNIQTRLILFSLNRAFHATKKHPFPVTSKYFSLFLASFNFISYLCRQSGKDPLGRRSVMLLTCGTKTWEIFKQGCNKQEGTTASAHLCVGLCSIFLLQVFSRPSFRNWQGSPALLLCGRTIENQIRKKLWKWNYFYSLYSWVCVAQEH